MKNKLRKRNIDLNQTLRIRHFHVAGGAFSWAEK